MSILSALRTQTDSIDDLAALPQAMIMQMAQKKQIREDMIAPILSRKAEMAEASARNQALKAQGQQPTVMEQLMQRNAIAEQPAPVEQTDVGIGQLPVNPAMFQEQSMAGGGIVAFAKGDLVEEMTEEERAEYIKNNPYLQRSQAIINAPAGFADFIKEYNPITGSKFREGVASFFNESPESQAARFRAASNRTAQAQNPREEVPAIATASQRQSIADQLKANTDFDKATELYQQERNIKMADKKAPAGNVTTQADKKSDAKPAMTPLEDLFSRQEKLIESEREASKAARDDAKNMRLLEAGLGILGGESPYAFSNIGKGAASAVKGYGEDVAGLRKEERQRTKDLMEIQKERADMDYKGKLLKIQELAATKPDSTSQIISLGRKAGLDDRALLGLLAGNKDTENSAKNIATKAYFENPMFAQKYGSLDKYLSSQGLGVQAQLPAGIPPGSVQVGTSKGKPVYKAPDGKQYVVS
jgi:hypothetical protein